MKKLKFLLVFVSIFLFNILSAQQTPQYYNFNTGNSNSFPFGMISGKAVQWLFLPGEFNQPLPVPPGNRISKIWFLIYTGGSREYTNLTVKMAQDNITTLTPGTFYSGPMETVYSRTSVTISGTTNNWMPIELDIPFSYDPLKSLIVTVSQCSAGTGTGIAIMQTNLGPYRRIWSSGGCPFVPSTGGDGYAADLGIDLAPEGLLYPPGLTSPLNNTVLANPLLSWHAVSGAAGYKVKISTDNTFAFVTDSASLVTNQYTIPEGKLNFNTTYYWKAAAVDELGTEYWSSVWNFSTSEPVPVLLAPVNNSLNIPVNPVLTWKIVTGAESYKIKISNDPTFTTGVNSVTVTANNYPVPYGVLNYGTKYYWKAAGYKAGSPEIWSDVWDFTTINYTSIIPELITPQNNSSNILITPLLVWNPVYGSTGYFIKISTDPSFENSIDTSVSGIQLQIPYGKLNFLTKYYWKVAAYNINTTGQWSSVWNFTVMSEPPQYFNYSNVGITNSYPFAVNGREVQWLFLAGDFNQPEPLPANQLITKISFFMETGGTRTYTDLTIKMAQDEITTLINGSFYPGNFQTVYYKSSVTLTAFNSSWMNITLDTPYPYDPSKSLILSVSQCSSTGTGMTIKQNSLTQIRRIWSVAGCPFVPYLSGNNQVANLGFKIIPNAPTEAPVLLSPLNNSLGISLTPALSWDTVQRATGYKLKISTDSEFNNSFDTTVAVNQLQIPAGILNTNTKYFWKTAGYNEFNTGPWSETWCFMTYSTPQEKIQMLTATIDSMQTAGILNKGNANSFRVKLTAALEKINKQEFNVAENILQAFINETEDYIIEQILTPEQGQNLIDRTNALIDQIRGDKTQKPEVLPKVFKLYQNYPNPFNPVTKIKYDIPEKNNNVPVKLMIYDLLGREVEILVNETKQPGSYEAIWNAGKYSSGVYFYRLIAGKYTEVKRMVIVK
jgi:hypothetical protein